MTVNYYSVRDSKVGFSTPFACENDDAALRMFIATVRSDKPNFCNTFPQDKYLYKLFTFDQDSGRVVENQLVEMACADHYVIEPDLEAKNENDV